jgi:hypothetical protein
MIKAIFFDFDGVLTTDPNGKTAIFRNLSEKISQVDAKDIAQCYSKWNDDHKCGKVNWKDIHEANLAVPKRMGFHTYFHDCEKNDTKALITQLQELGVSVK